MSRATAAGAKSPTLAKNARTGHPQQAFCSAQDAGAGREGAQEHESFVEWKRMREGGPGKRAASSALRSLRTWVASLGPKR